VLLQKVKLKRSRLGTIAKIFISTRLLRKDGGAPGTFKKTLKYMIFQKL